MPRILIIDDSQTEVLVIKTLLEKNGYQTLPAYSGEEGLRKAREERPDLILMDVVMPGLNGFQATRQLSRDAATSAIPVIMVTTKDQETDKVWAMRQGAKEYIVKPVTEAELVRKVRAVLGA